MTDCAVVRVDAKSSIAKGEAVDNSAGATARTCGRLTRVVYVVVGQRDGRINDRVRKILELESDTIHFRLVSRTGWIQFVRERTNAPGSTGDTLGSLPRSSEYRVPAYPSPLAFLQWIGLDRLRKKLSRYLFFPSSQILYAKKVFHVLRRAITVDLKEGREVVLLTCLPPHDLAVLGTRLKQALPAIRWVVDWQDLWSYDENYFSRVSGLYRSRLLGTEKTALENCDLNITTNDRAMQVLTDEYGVSPGHVVAIPHHFQTPGAWYYSRPAEAASHDDVGPDGNHPIRVAFLGSLFKPPKVPGHKLLEVFDRLRKEFAIDLELHLYGGLPTCLSDRSELEHDSGLIVHPKVPHDQVPAELSQYDFLVLLLDDLPNCRVVMHIKLPQYLIAGPPILAMVPADSCVAEVVRDTGTGYVIDTGSDWTLGLLAVLDGNGGQTGLPLRNEAAIDNYSWDAVSCLWSEVFVGTKSHS